MRLLRVVLVVAPLIAGASACGPRTTPPAPRAPLPVSEAQARWKGVFDKPLVEEIAPGVHMARGYGLANAVMLVGPSGRIIIDTMETDAAARAVKAAFDAISTAPIQAIVFTHAHPDHTGGANVFCEGGDIPIYAHARHFDLVAEQRTAAGSVYRMRAIRQFGLLLGDSPTHLLRLDLEDLAPPVLPTKTFDGEKFALDAAGLHLELIHAPGESIDQIVVWMPDKKVLICGDDVYASLPNLYTLRGEPSRDVQRWGDVIDQLRALGAEYLVPGHGVPLKGADAIREMLTAYGDAIQFIHDQTLKGAYEGKTPDELAHTIALPPHLAAHPWLQEVYGRVDWSVRAVYDHYFGFFDGLASHLHGMPPAARAKHWAELAGGADKLRDALDRAVAAKDFAWAAELADTLLAMDPADTRARAGMAAACDGIAANDTSLNGINYARTLAAEYRGDFVLRDPTDKLGEAFVRALPLETVFRTLACRLDAKASENVDTVACFKFPDTGETWTLHVRRGVAEFSKGETEKAAIALSIDSFAWKQMLLRQRNPAATLLGSATIEGGLLATKNFLELFRSE